MDPKWGTRSILHDHSYPVMRGLIIGLSNLGTARAYNLGLQSIASSRDCSCLNEETGPRPRCCLISLGPGVGLESGQSRDKRDSQPAFKLLSTRIIKAMYVHADLAAQKGRVWSVWLPRCLISQGHSVHIGMPQSDWRKQAQPCLTAEAKGCEQAAASRLSQAGTEILMLVTSWMLQKIAMRAAGPPGHPRCFLKLQSGVASR